jgi:stage V sporulation protein S
MLSDEQYVITGGIMSVPSAIAVAVPEDVLRVKGSSNANSLASAISHAVYDGKKVTLRAIGAAAVNQAVKACAIAGGFCAQRGTTLSFRPGFTTVDLPGKGEVTAITLRVLPD